jgi:hypothetical protein
MEDGDENFTPVLELEGQGLDDGPEDRDRDRERDREKDSQKDRDRDWLDKLLPGSGNGTDRSSSSATSNLDAVSRSHVLIACLSKRTALSAQMEELRAARRANPPLPVVVVYLDAAHEEWMPQEVRYCCQLLSQDTLEVDLSDLCSRDDWLFENGPKEAVLLALNKKIDLVAQRLEILLRKPQGVIQASR